MKCPVCDVDLLMTERQGIEIDYCPKCRGVWLDRGELDKIIDRAGAELAATAPPARGSHEPGPPARREEPGYSEPREYYEHEHHEREHHREHHDRHEQRSYGGHPKKKRGASFLSDIFEGFSD